MIMIKIQYSSKALLLLVNPHIPQQNIGTVHLLFEKKMLCCQLCSTRYKAVRINNCLKRTSAIKVATIKITDDFHYEWSHQMPTTKSTLFVVSKDEWDPKEGPGSPWRMDCMYSGVAIKGTSQDEATSNSEKIKPVVLVIVELRDSNFLVCLYTIPQTILNSSMYVICHICIA